MFRIDSFCEEKKKKKAVFHSPVISLRGKVNLLVFLAAEVPWSHYEAWTLEAQEPIQKKSWVMRRALELAGVKAGRKSPGLRHGNSAYSQFKAV